MLAKYLGYKTIIITARPGMTLYKMYTKQQLKHFDIVPDILLFAPAHKKTEVKKSLNKNIIMSFGDQLTDLCGSTWFVKLPDYIDHKYYMGDSNTSSDFCM